MRARCDIKTAPLISHTPGRNSSEDPQTRIYHLSIHAKNINFITTGNPISFESSYETFNTILRFHGFKITKLTVLLRHLLRYN